MVLKNLPVWSLWGMNSKPDLVAAKAFHSVIWHLKRKKNFFPPFFYIIRVGPPTFKSGHTHTHHTHTLLVQLYIQHDRKIFFHFCIVSHDNIYAPQRGVEHSSEGIYGYRLHNAKLFDRIEHSGIQEGIKCKQTNAAAAGCLIPYNSLADVIRLLAEWSDTKSNIKLGGFRSQLHVSYLSSHTEELWYNETVCRW